VRNASNSLSFDSVEPLWTFQLLGVEVFQDRLQQKATSTVSIEVHKGAIFDRLKIKKDL
jgi:hypothetical protein